MALARPIDNTKRHSGRDECHKLITKERYPPVLRQNHNWIFTGSRFNSIYFNVPLLGISYFNMAGVCVCVVYMTARQVGIRVTYHLPAHLWHFVPSGDEI